MSGPGLTNFQNFLGPIESNIELLFFWTISQIILVAFGVFVIIGINIFNGGFYRHEKATPYYEIFWTSFPTIVLCTVAIPSISLLYSHEQEVPSPLSLKCIGHQWYWSYEYSDFEDIELDSFMLPSEDLFQGENRYLEVDNRAFIPVNSNIRCLISSEDVIHAWSLPSVSLNVDATPGRLSLINLYFPSPGVFYGQCSELCGANHSFIPIVVESSSPSLFNEWINII